MSLWIIGNGRMSQEYQRVLIDLQIEFMVICRRKDSIHNSVGKYYFDGLERALMEFQAPDRAIVAVDIENLYEITCKLLDARVKNILIEKPGSLYLHELIDLKEKSKEIQALIFIGYNRRHYASVQKCLDIIKEDNGVKSVKFDFTEVSLDISKLELSNSVKNLWIIANSSHVLDLVFFMCGLPTALYSSVSGHIDWHPSGSKFGGVGFINSDILFSYFADWESPGRWGIELNTKKHKFILQPLEELKIMDLQSFEIKKVKLNDYYDKMYKPGIYAQTQSFMSNNSNNLCTLDEQINRYKIFSKIANYD
jgi:predicted dehydrogenase